jgi:UDPglucose 6-dehydrogenase
MQITVIGTGYVGLVTGTCLAEVGVDVTCVDIDLTKINNLRKGIIPIYEPGLEELVHINLEKGRLHFTTDLSANIEGRDIVFIAVGTPPDEDGSADLKYVLDVARAIGQHMNGYLLIVTKSTVPVGTSMKVKAVIEDTLTKRGLSIPFDVASNPEFLKEGNAVEDFMRPDRIVVGTDSKKAEAIIHKLFKPFTLNGHPIIFMDIASAEMTKYAANAMLATKISFMNDIANLCEIIGANINLVRIGIGSDSRIGNKFIYPGIGYGGSCFPKDVKALIKTGKEHGYLLRVLKAVEDVNEDQKAILFDRLNSYYEGHLQGKVIALWGLSFKPQTDDMREAPSLVLIDRLIHAGSRVRVYDPAAMVECRRRIGDVVEYAADLYSSLHDADALLLATEWKEFRLPDMSTIKKHMRQPVIFDGRNIWDANEMTANGFDYFCIGINTNK